MGDLSGDDLFHSASASAGLFIGRPLHEPSTERACLPIALALQRPAHGLRIVLAVLDLATLSRAYEEQRPKPGGAITLMRRDGVVLAWAPQPASALDQFVAVQGLFDADRAQQPRAFLALKSLLLSA